ncbi:hypothetical protein PhCBS80983_g01993 [Powellomyces hirtus]|uniref:Uncharacterized protein n=1 Tax=Powellomyces hirtus TaxID=109895 RepID=A0A507EAP5_9FUNG|nr:hypothetical protein PhCBS80983_g01993 [Powellomyces hirtus]
MGRTKPIWRNPASTEAPKEAQSTGANTVGKAQSEGAKRKLDAAAPQPPSKQCKTEEKKSDAGIQREKTSANIKEADKKLEIGEVGNVPKQKEKDSRIRHKRAVQRPPTLATDIYVSRKSNFYAQSKRAQKLIDGQNFTFLTIHGLGAAINRAIELALHVKEQNKDRIAWSITTSTVTLADDVEPENVDDELEIATRQNSAVHIKIVRVSQTPTHAE